VLSVRQINREKAGELIRAAYRLDPSHPETARRLARYLFATDALEELVGNFKSKLDTPELDPECLHYVGLAASALDDHRLAESALSRAVSKGHAGSRGPWARALYHLQKTTEAYSIAIQTLEQNLEDDWAGQVVFKTLLAEGRRAELWNLCERLRAASVWTSRAVSALALAAHTPEQIAFVRQITDKDVWVEHRSLGLAPSWVRQFAANLALSDRWTSLPRVKATVGGGKRIEAVHAVVGDFWLDSIFRHIRGAVAAYVEKRIDLLASRPHDQPMAAMKPVNPSLTGWVVSVNGNGHEEWHIHPDGWLSGIFYVDVPDLSISEAPHAGQIEFGPLPLGASMSVAAWPRWMLQPRAGDLILFPSFFAHRTWPTHLEKDRICIAFDVLRRGVESVTAAPSPGCAPPKIALDERVSRSGRAVFLPDNEGWQLIMNVYNGQCAAVDDAGALIWSLLETPRTAREIASLLLRDFEGRQDEIQRDVSEALGHMVNCGLAVVA